MRTLQTPQQPFNQTALSLWKIIEVMLTLASHKPRTVPLSLSKPLLSRFYYAVCSVLPALAAPTTVVSLISPQWPSPTPGAPGATVPVVPHLPPHTALHLHTHSHLKLYLASSSPGLWFLPATRNMQHPLREERSYVPP